MARAKTILFRQGVYLWFIKSSKAVVLRKFTTFLLHNECCLCKAGHKYRVKGELENLNQVIRLVRGLK